MGMTGDYMVAIEEGATMVRVGTGIFGERNYQKHGVVKMTIFTILRLMMISEDVMRHLNE